jgi:hypothetical protein
MSEEIKPREDRSFILVQNSKQIGINNMWYLFQSLHQTFSGSLIPPLVMMYVASFSGMSVTRSAWCQGVSEAKHDLPGESCNLATRSSPRPLRSSNRVAEACARICPPTGLRPSAPAKSALAPGSLWTWFVIRTATLNSKRIWSADVCSEGTGQSLPSAMCVNLERNWLSFC